MKILLWDIESSPNLGYTWTKWETNVIAFKQEWELLSFSYKWLGEKEVHAVSRQGQKSDKQITKKLHALLNQADITIAHNGNSFDNKKARAKFLEHGLAPTSPFKSIDTRLEARKHFKFNSNSLDDLGRLLGVGRKEKTGGFDLWLECMANNFKGSNKAWKQMLKYNQQDVLLLERVYLKMRPYIKHPFMGNLDGCHACGSENIKSNGFRAGAGGSYRRYVCLDCGAWSRERIAEKNGPKAKIVGL